MRREVGNVGSIEKDFPMSGGQESRQKIEKGGLPSSIGANDGVNPSPSYLEVNEIYRPQGAKVLTQIFRL